MQSSWVSEISLIDLEPQQKLTGKDREKTMNFHLGYDTENISYLFFNHKFVINSFILFATKLIKSK